jgi:O-antigen ligase
MLALFQNKKWAAADASVLALVLAIASIHVSPAAASLLLGLALLSTLFSGPELGVHKWGLTVAVMLLAIEWFGSESSHRIALHLPLYVAMSIRPGQEFAQRWIQQFYALYWAWLLPLLWISLASLMEFAQHPEFYRQMVMESKPMPLFSQVYHIEYSILQAVLILMLIRGMLCQQIERSIWAYGALVLMTLCLHALSARTGILTFWVGVTGLSWPYRQRFNRRYVWLVPCLLLLMTLGTMGERLQNSWHDLQTMVQHADPNHQSMAQRLEAWKAAIKSINHKPLLGWGSAQVEQAMTWSYEQQTRLNPENWIGPHNQYLELVLQGGLAALLLVVIWVMNLIRQSKGFAWVAGLAVAMVFESIGERQAGMLVLVLVVLIWQFEANRPRVEEKSVNEAGLLDL